jgi:Transposase, Mutator family
MEHLVFRLILRMTEFGSVANVSPEDKAGWSVFLKHLKERGLKGVRLIISDACISWPKAPPSSFPMPSGKVVVHYRNIFRHVPSTKMREIAAMLKAIHAGEDIAAARQKAVQVIEKLRGLRLTKAAELVETAVEEALAYYAFPEEHWRRIRTNIPPLRRRSQIGIFNGVEEWAGENTPDLHRSTLTVLDRHISDTRYRVLPTVESQREVRSEGMGDLPKRRVAIDL